MKNFRFLFFLIGLIAFTSCQFTEKITFDNNNSGRYAFTIDMSQMVSQMKQMEQANDSIQKDAPKEVVDTLILFKDIIEENKDSIAKLSPKERAKLESLKDLKLHISIDEEKEKAVTEFILDFKNISELRNIQQKIKTAQNLNAKGKEDKIKQPTDVLFTFNGNTFHRQVIENPLTDAEKEAYEKNLQQSMSILNASSYTIEYHFPKPVKSTTYEGATFSSDRKTMYIKTDMNTMINNPKKFDFKVILE